MMVSVELRDATEDDAPAVVAIANQGSPQPTSVEQFLRLRAERNPADLFSYRVADDAGEVVGFATAEHFPIEPADWLTVRVQVDADHRGRGVGRQLWADAEEVAARVSPRMLTAQVRDDAPTSRDWAEQRGFEVWAHRFQSVLDLNGFDPGPFAATLDAVAAAGVEIAPYSALADEPGAAERLHQLVNDVMVSTPDNDTGTTIDRAELDRFFLNPSIHPPEGLMIARDGEAWVGISSLMHREPGFIYTSVSGVLPSHRSRGIATALKVRSTEVARSLGATRMGTNNLSINEPILALNRKMGYVPQPGLWLMRKPL